MMVKPPSSRSKERGSALVYILVAIALLAVLTATLSDSSSQQVSSQKSFDLGVDLKTQIDFIRSSIQECVISYPKGDPAAPVTNKPYPLNPTNAYLSPPLPTYDFASGVRCPGNPGNSNAHEPIFSGSSGKFLPPSPKLFNQWFYINHADGVFIMIPTISSDAYIKAALAKLDDQFSECEADVIDATAAARNLTSDGIGGICNIGEVCFRVWLVQNPSNVYLGDADGDETGCP